MLGALMIQGIQPGPQLIKRASGHLLGPDRELLDRQHHAGHPQRAADRRVGEAADGALRYLYPSALFFVCDRRLLPPTTTCSRSARPSSSALLGYLLLLLDFQPAPILLGFVLGPRFEENFRRAMLISRGDALVFVERPISAFFLFLCAVLDRWRRSTCACASRRRSWPRCLRWTRSDRSKLAPEREAV